MKKWKDIPGYENSYIASGHGEIKSVKRIVFNGVAKYYLKERILKPIENGNGYLCVCLRKGGKSNRVYIHRLVAMAFLKNLDYSLEVNHIDGNRSNNIISNLEWVTRSQNHYHRYNILGQSGVNKGKTGALNWCSKPVEMMNSEGTVIKSFPGVMEAARNLSINEASIRCAIYGRSKTCNGHIWKYK